MFGQFIATIIISIKSRFCCPCLSIILNQWEYGAENQMGLYCGVEVPKMETCAATGCKQNTCKSTFELQL